MKVKLTPRFDGKDVRKHLAIFGTEVMEATISVLTYVGESFVNSARNIATYHDQTGNLRSSIGYVIGIDGTIVKKNLSDARFKGVSTGGKERAVEIAKEILNENKKGYVLVGFAGMEYAAAVESKGFDVITNSVPAAGSLLKELKQYLKVQ